MAQSQDSGKVRKKQPRLYFGINAGPSMNQFINEGTQSLEGLTFNTKNSLSGSFETGYYFSKAIGISTGLRYDSYRTEFTLNSYSSNYNTKDSENDTYEKRITGSNIKELQDITFLSLPLCINIRIPSGSRFGLFLQTGVTYSLSVNSIYNSSGMVSIAGYYPTYNVLIQNSPEYGFPSDIKVLSEGNLSLNSNIIDGIACGGFQLYISRKLQIFMGVEYKRTLTNISIENLPDKFQLFSETGQINSLFGLSGKNRVESKGLRISLRYYL